MGVEGVMVGLGESEHVKAHITIGHRMFWEIIEFNSQSGEIDVTRVGFMGILLATLRMIKWRGKDPSSEVLMVR